jgi:hypothetical protein
MPTIVGGMPETPKWSPVTGRSQPSRTSDYRTTPALASQVREGVSNRPFDTFGALLASSQNTTYCSSQPLVSGRQINDEYVRKKTADAVGVI